MKFLLILLTVVSVNSYGFEILTDEEASREHAGSILSNDINLSILNTIPLFNMIDFNNREFIRSQSINKDGTLSYVLNDIERINIKSSIGNVELLGVKLGGTTITIGKK